MAALANGIVYEIDHLNEGIARENTREKAEIIAKNAYMRALISRDRACGKCLYPIILTQERTRMSHGFGGRGLHAAPSPPIPYDSDPKPQEPKKRER